MPMLRPFRRDTSAPSSRFSVPPVIPPTMPAEIPQVATHAPAVPAISIMLQRSFAPAAARFYRPELDMLRFFAFFGVFFYHTAMFPAAFFAKHHLPASFGIFENSVAEAGAFGVDLFFALSAYLITELLLREKQQHGDVDVPAFYARRILRIWPLYFAFLALVVLVPVLNPRHVLSFRYIIPFFLLVGNWACVVFGFPAHSIAAPLWSVCIEEQFYLLWPPVVRHATRRNILYSAIAMLGLANLARVGAVLLHAQYPKIWCNTLTRLDPIAMGIVVAVVLGGAAPSFRPAARLALLACGLSSLVLVGWGADLAHLAPLRWQATMIGYPVVAIGCTLILLAVLGSQWRGTDSAALRYLGKISYGLYVYHMLGIWIADRLLSFGSSLLRGGARFVLALGLTIIISAISYRFLEAPFLRLKRQFTYVPSRPI
jgi:peptidoglycan/LPS O-acetylase OafA/YrhL